jgi:lysophospholipase L1-like esterase
MLQFFNEIIILATFGSGQLPFLGLRSPRCHPVCAHSMKLLCLGDSYTIGESVAPEQRWPMQLTARIASTLGAPAVQIIAQTGWTTDELLAAIANAEQNGALDTGYEFVSLLIGVNNQYRGREISNFSSEFSTLLLRALALAQGHAARVWVLSIPDWAWSPFGAADARGQAVISAEIAAFNRVCHDQALALGCHFVDITSGASAHAEFTASDGLHPSALAYSTWVDQILPMLHASLSDAPGHHVKSAPASNCAKLAQ